MPFLTDLMTIYLASQFWTSQLILVTDIAMILRLNSQMTLFSSWLIGHVLCPIDSKVIESWYPHLLSLAKDVKLFFISFQLGIEARALQWQSITLPLHHDSDT